jgi:uncharacterized membrane protein
MKKILGLFILMIISFTLFGCDNDDQNDDKAYDITILMTPIPIVSGLKKTII